MGEYVPDNFDAYDRHEARRMELCNRYPVCDYCGEPITEDYYDLDGDLICKECLDHNFKKRIDNYIE